MSTSLDPVAMRARFHELGKQKQAIHEQAAPHRKAYEQSRAQIDALRDLAETHAAQARQIEAPLFDIDQERGNLALALNGKTGEPT